MERWIDRMMVRSVPFKKVRLTVLDLLFIIIMIGLSLVGRVVLMQHVSGDYDGFLRPWMERIRELGGWPSLGHEVSNYPSSYMIIMSFLSYFDAEPLYLLKAVSIGFDYVAAAAVFMIIYQLTNSTGKAIGAAGGLLLMPTAVLNGAFWGQCDMIYISFLLWGFYFLCRGDGSKALWLTAIGFAFKLQALFIIPFYLIMWLCPPRHKGGGTSVRLTHLLALPIPYLLLTLPGIMLGRDGWNSIGVYLEQAGTYPWLTLNYPNVYAFFRQTYLSDTQIAELGSSGVLMTILALGMLAYYLYRRRLRQSLRMDGEMMITVALLSVGLVLYGVPYMHERYGLLVDVLAILYAVLRPRRLPVAVGLIISSLIAYMPFLFGREEMPPLYHAIAQLGLLVAVGWDLRKQCEERG